MTTPDPLGIPATLKIWHDNSGEGKKAGWYCSKVVIVDLKLNKWYESALALFIDQLYYYLKHLIRSYMHAAKFCQCLCTLRYLFLVDDWLSADEADGWTQRTVRLSKNQDIAAAKSLLRNNIKRKFFDDHIWLSVGYRKSRSSFTRVQRLCCCLAILYLMMITNAMFYGKGNETGNQAAILIGPIRITIMQLYTSIISGLIVVPPMLVVREIFARARPRPKQHKNGDTQNAEAMGATDRAKTKEKGFPWWTIYIAYTILVAAVAASAFFTILYAFEWGKQKSEKWLVTFIFSFVESVLLIQPLKVCVSCQPQDYSHSTVRVAHSLIRQHNKT